MTARSRAFGVRQTLDPATPNGVLGPEGPNSTRMRAGSAVCPMRPMARGSRPRADRLLREWYESALVACGTLSFTIAALCALRTRPGAQGASGSDRPADWHADASSLARCSLPEVDPLKLRLTTLADPWLPHFTHGPRAWSSSRPARGALLGPSQLGDERGGSNFGCKTVS